MYRVALYHDSQSSIGKALECNPVFAFEYANQAAISGHVEAQNLLGDFLTRGYGTSVDVEKGTHWKTLASRQSAATLKHSKCIIL